MSQSASHLIRKGRFQRAARRTAAAAAFGVAALALMPGGASAQDMQALIDRIERLERDIRTLNVQLARGEGTAVPLTGSEPSGSQPSGGGTAGGDIQASATARFDARLTALENDLRSTTGAIEDLGYQIRQVSDRLEKLISDVDYRLSALEKGGGAGAATQGNAGGQGSGGAGSSGGNDEMAVAAAPAPDSVERLSGDQGTGVLGTITESDLKTLGDNAGDTEASGSGGGSNASEEAAAATTNAAPAENGTGGQSADAAPQQQASAPAQGLLPEGSPQDQYTYAFGLLRQARYGEAAGALEEFIQRHPDDPLAANARYWWGETFYVRAEFVRAAEIFLEGYQAAPDGPKAPDTLLKLGMALGNLGKQREACAAFAKLDQEFPDASGNIKSTMDRERARNACQN